ncbi:hypothetical protein [Campylobacter suis]|uniref:Uncharacterized protein n=1 Tax=Campylobacter suis TaxID=2790657 RepID=A0ABM8Q882_9BACT|nr:hypothetical protein [Campylobacter suis]CAD7289033.1 hypothetical protein LMG8286_01618 [Campylobacter suis]
MASFVLKNKEKIKYRTIPKNTNLFKQLADKNFSGKSISCKDSDREYLFNELIKICDKKDIAQDLYLKDIDLKEEHIYILTDNNKHYLHYDNKTYKIQDIDLLNFYLNNKYKKEEHNAFDLGENTKIISLNASDGYIDNEDKIPQNIISSDNIDKNILDELKKIQNKIRKTVKISPIWLSLIDSIHFIMFNIEGNNVLYAIRPTDKVYDIENIHFGFYRDSGFMDENRDDFMQSLYKFQQEGEFDNFSEIQRVSYIYPGKNKNVNIISYKDNLYIKEEWYKNLFASSGYGLKAVLFKLLDNANMLLYKENINNIFEYKKDSFRYLFDDFIHGKSKFKFFSFNIKCLYKVAIWSVLIYLIFLLPNVVFMDKIAVVFAILAIIYFTYLFPLSYEEKIFKKRELIFKTKNFGYKVISSDLKSLHKIIQENSITNKENQKLNNIVDEYFNLKEKTYHYNSNKRSIIFAVLAIIISALALTGYVEYEVKQFFGEPQRQDGYVLTFFKHLIGAFK